MQVLSLTFKDTLRREEACLSAKSAAGSTVSVLPCSGSSHEEWIHDKVWILYSLKANSITYQIYFTVLEFTTLPGIYLMAKKKFEMEKYQLEVYLSLSYKKG